MQFLVPLYLLGALAVAVPVYLHLRRKPPKDRMEFGSLMFLRPTDHPPVKRQRKVDQLPLLLLRCLALLLLAAFFARPFMRGGEKDLEASSQSVVLLVDTSASMRRDGLWEEALGMAEERIDSLRGGDRLAVVAFDDSVRRIVGFDGGDGSVSGRGKKLAKEALRSLNPGWGGSGLGDGVRTAAEMLSEADADGESTGGGMVVVISDLQSGADLSSAGEISWPGGVVVEFLRPEIADTTNASMSLVAGTEPGNRRVRVWNDGASEREVFTIESGDARINAVVPAGESRVFDVPEGSDLVTLTGDGHGFDNRLFITSSRPAPVPIAFLGSDAPDDPEGPEYYFRSAFGGSRFLSPRFVNGLEEPAQVLAVARPLDGDEAEVVAERLTGGGRVLLVLTDVSMAETLGKLAGLATAPSLREADGRPAMLEDVDFDHPAMRGYTDPRWRDFTNVHFWKHRVVEGDGLPDARIIAGFDSGDPALAELSVGRGSLLIMFSGWHPADSQLALSSKFVPLLYSLFADRGLTVGEPETHRVGEGLPLEDGDGWVVLPGGQRLALDRTGFRPTEPGIYEIDGEFGTRRYAVNLRRGESDFQPMGTEAFEALGVPLSITSPAVREESPEGRRSLRDRESEADQKIWKLAALGMLGLLLVETVVVSRSRNNPTTMEGAPS